MQVKNEKTINAILDMINDYYIQYRESPTMDKIAEKLGISKATASRYVNVLIERGLLSEQADTALLRLKLQISTTERCPNTLL